MNKRSGLTLIEVAYIILVAAIFMLVFSGIMAGCAVAPERTFRDDAVLSRTEEAWRSAFGSHKTPDDCLDDISVVQVRGDGFERLCHKPAFFSEGCVESRGVGYAPGKVMYISPYVQPNLRDDAIVHLALHEMFNCTAERGDRTPKDDNHMHPEAWIDSAGDASLEAFIIRGIRGGVMN